MKTILELFSEHMESHPNSYLAKNLHNGKPIFEKEPHHDDKESFSGMVQEIGDWIQLLKDNKVEYWK